MSGREQCATCAFREGCETTREPYNVLKALICINSGQPFFCHDQVHWRTVVASRELVRRVGICRGWQAEVRKRVAWGWFGPQSSLRQTFGKIALAALEEFVALEDGPEKRKAYRLLGRALKAICRRDVKGRLRAKAHRGEAGAACGAAAVAGLGRLA